MSPKMVTITNMALRNQCGPTFFGTPSPSWKLTWKFPNVLITLTLLLLSSITCTPSKATRHTDHLSPRVIRTKFGIVRGVINSIGMDGVGDAEVFLGIPYAEPPVGNLRLMPPGTPSPWRNIRVAQHLSPVCPQRLPDIRNRTEALKTMSLGRYIHLTRLLPYLRNQSEDCLYLNIYSPSGETEGNNAISFLDMGRNNLQLQVHHHKPTRSDQHLGYESHHPPHHKVSVIRSLYNQTKKKFRAEEDVKLRTSLVADGYPHSIINDIKSKIEEPANSVDLEATANTAASQSQSH